LLKQDMQKSRGFDRWFLLVFFFLSPLKSSCLNNHHAGYLILFHSPASHAMHFEQAKK